MNQDQIDFVDALNTVDNRLSEYAKERFEAGFSFNEVQAQFKRCADFVTSWRIGRGV